LVKERVKMTQPIDPSVTPELEEARKAEYHNRPILDQLDRIEATLDGVVVTLAADADNADELT